MRFIICFILTILFTLFTPDGRSEASQREIEDTLASVRLGSTTKELGQIHPGLYKHRLIMGEILHESCNQKELEVFTFSEEIWSLGYITDIWIRKEKNVSVCRDTEGTLPDLTIKPVTPRGIRLGDGKNKVLQAYGTPTKTKQLQDGAELLTYRTEKMKAEVLVKNLAIHFKIKKNLVISFSISGDMPWAKKPR